MLPPCNGDDDRLANELWQKADGDEAVSWLLGLPLTHPAGRALLFHHEELFPTVHPEMAGAPERVMAEYFVWNSHTIRKQEQSLSQVTLDAERIAGYRDANTLMDQIMTVVQDSTRDSIVLAGLRSVQQNPVFQRLVGGPDAIHFGQMKKEAKDYRDIDWTGAMKALQDLWDKIHSGSQSRAIINTAAVNMHMFIDMLSHMMDGCQLGLISYLLTHQKDLIRRLSVAEAQYRNLLLLLNQAGMLSHSGPAVAVCSHCPGGSITTLRTAFLARAIRCPVCGHRTRVMTTLRPVSELACTLHLRDGFIGGHVGWLLREHRMPFCHPYLFSDGTEIDFLVHRSSGLAVVECKTHKRGARLVDEFTQDRNQLYDRLEKLTATAIEVTEGVGVSNLTSEELRPFRGVGLRPDAVHQTRLLSFEEFQDWL